MKPKSSGVFYTDQPISNRTEEHYTMRTKGKIGVFRDLNPCHVGTMENQIGSFNRIPDSCHAVACWNAIESIGGDPATVGELVKAADKLVPFMEDTIGSKTVRIYAADRIRIKVLLKLLTETKVTP